MTPKAIINLVVGILALAVTAWKGPSAWSAASAGLASVCLFFGTLSIVPKKDAEYIDDLETALASKATAQDVPAGPSRARFARKMSH